MKSVSCHIVHGTLSLSNSIALIIGFWTKRICVILCNYAVPFILNSVNYYTNITNQKCYMVQKYIELCNLLCLIDNSFDRNLYFVEESRYMEKVLQIYYKVLKASK